MDVHLAWRAACCRYGGGEVFLGTAPRSNFRTAALLLKHQGADVMPEMGRVIIEYGMVLPLDGVISPSAPCLGILRLEGDPPCDGYQWSMLTVSLGAGLGEQYLQALPEHTGPEGADPQVGFFVLVGVEPPAAEGLLDRVRAAGTVRMADLQRLVPRVITAS